MFKGTAMPSKQRQYKLSIHITDYQLSTKPAQRHKPKPGRLNFIVKIRCYICYDVKYIW